MNEAKHEQEVEGLRRTGVLSCEELADCPGVPTDDRLRKGPVAVIECQEEIPCNPCECNCPREAIHVGDTVTSRPYLDVNECVGCALCASRCPGLAIFVVDLSQEDGDRVSVPYEFLPLPEIGDTVRGVDRSGSDVCAAEVLGVNSDARNDRTAVITLRVPKGLGMTVRFFRAAKREM